MPARLVPPRSPITNSLTGRAVLEQELPPPWISYERSAAASPRARPGRRPVSVAGSSRSPRRAPSPRQPTTAIHDLTLSARGLHGLGDSAPLCSALLQEWVDAFERERDGFSSMALFIEAKLRRALQATAGLPTPNAFRTAVVFDCLDKLKGSLGRYESVLGLLIRELTSAVYAGRSARELGGGGVAAYLEANTYFERAERAEREVVLLRRAAAGERPSDLAAVARETLAALEPEARAECVVERLGIAARAGELKNIAAAAAKLHPSERRELAAALSGESDELRFFDGASGPAFVDDGGRPSASQPPSGGRPPPGVALFWSN